ncbi:hypothetical protein CTEN210_08165 [Chaetoceros tenuissimus]|uniref:Uncharacterized protein n=1 Tax=Chaetoceros tenuissimus TaxID=426638 RepID=A0AAD3CW55_9STRA|nr:hypothetical protein CTEN210_08165 [Chaetoceros tenuissimus]
MDSQLNDLRLRLQQRNALLDIIRKAYHRDVIVVRECLLALKNGVDPKELKPEDIDLRSIPSIDLRTSQGFHLFSPEECELTIKSCFHCGGRYELTHYESSRYMQLMQCCERLKERERHLDGKLVESNQRIEDGKIILLKQECEALEEQNRLHEEIEKLNLSVADRDALYKLCNEQAEKISELEEVASLKIQLEATLEQITTDLKEACAKNSFLEEQADELSGQKGKLEIQCQMGLQREHALNNRLQHLHDSNQEMLTTIATLETLENQLQEEVQSSRVELRRQDGVIRIANENIANLQTKLNHTIQERDNTVSKFENTISTMNQEIQELQQQLQLKNLEFDKYRNDAEKMLKVKQEEESIRIAKDEEEKKNLKIHIGSLQNLCLSHIQGLYEQCLDQERILKREGANPKSSSIHQKPKTSSAFEVVEERLLREVASTSIEWKTLISDDKARRSVLGNLNNRVLMNIGYIDCTIQRLHKRHSNEMKRTKIGHDQVLKDTTENFSYMIQELEFALEEKASALREFASKYQEKDKLLTKSETKVACIEKELESAVKQSLQLRNDLIGTKDTLEKTKDSLQRTTNQLSNSNTQVEGLKADVIDRDETLAHLESLLQSTAERFSKQLEEERLRLETNVEVGIQVKPPT